MLESNKRETQIINDLNSEKKIDSQLSNLEINSNILEQNINAAGGENKIEEKWSALSDSDREIILKNIQEYIETGKKLRDDQLFGISLLNPIKSYEAAMDEEHGIGKILGFFAGTAYYFSGAAPGTGIVELVKATHERLKNAILLKREENKITSED